MGFIHHGISNILFNYSELNPPIEEQLYLFMKRFRTQPSEFYALERDVRIRMYKREYKLLKDEYEDLKSKK